MATILILTHPYDLFPVRPFLLKAFFPHWEAMGHQVIVQEGPRGAPAADLAILHVDLTVIPQDYIDAMRGYPIAVNGMLPDLSKRAVSMNRVGPADGWRGPVILKTNANAAGMPERRHQEMARRNGVPVHRPVRFMNGRYPVFASIDRVPAAAHLDPDLVVEKFVPEHDPRGYASRHWILMGDRDRCTRLVGAHPVVKGSDMLERSHVAVPDELRAHRARLGLQYGKLDFVLHEGHPVVLDANRTPTLPSALLEVNRAEMGELAQGVTSLLTSEPGQ